MITKGWSLSSVQVDDRRQINKHRFHVVQPWQDTEEKAES